MTPENKNRIRTIAWVAVSFVFFLFAIYIYKSLPLDRKEKKDTKQVAIVEEVLTRKDGDLVYMYRVRENKIVDFGNPATIMAEVNKIAAGNHSRVLSITPNPGHTLSGADVTIGVYIVLSPIF